MMRNPALSPGSDNDFDIVRFGLAAWLATARQSASPAPDMGQQDILLDDAKAAVLVSGQVDMLLSQRLDVLGDDAMRHGLEEQSHERSPAFVAKRNDGIDVRHLVVHGRAGRRNDVVLVFGKPVVDPTRGRGDIAVCMLHVAFRRRQQ